MIHSQPTGNAGPSRQNYPNTETIDCEPVLSRLLEEARHEERDLQAILEAMGWQDLPHELVVEIRDDLLAFKRELEGAYSCCDPFVANRRKRVAYWVGMLLSGSCRLQTACEAIRIRPL